MNISLRNVNDIFDGWKIKMYLNNSETKKKLLMVYLKSFYCHFICIMCFQHEENVCYPEATSCCGGLIIKW